VKFTKPRLASITNDLIYVSLFFIAVSSIAYFYYFVNSFLEIFSSLSPRNPNFVG
jgi:hypothetical protein